MSGSLTRHLLHGWLSGTNGSPEDFVGGGDCDMSATSSGNSRSAGKLTTDADVIWLDIHRLDLAVLDYQRVPLAALVAQDGRSIEFDIERTCKCTGWVSEEADTTALVRVEGLCPSTHTGN